MEPDTKLVPLTVSVNALYAAALDEGDSDVIVGAPLLELTVKLTAFDVPPPGEGLTTVTLGVPDDAISDEGTLAVS